MGLAFGGYRRVYVIMCFGATCVRIISIVILLSFMCSYYYYYYYCYCYCYYYYQYYYCYYYFYYFYYYCSCNLALCSYTIIILYLGYLDWLCCLAILGQSACINWHSMARHELLNWRGMNYSHVGPDGRATGSVFFRTRCQFQSLELQGWVFSSDLLDKTRPCNFQHVKHKQKLQGWVLPSKSLEKTRPCNSMVQPISRPKAHRPQHHTIPLRDGPRDWAEEVGLLARRRHRRRRRRRRQLTFWPRSYSPSIFIRFQVQKKISGCIAREYAWNVDAVLDMRAKLAGETIFEQFSPGPLKTNSKTPIRQT